MRVLITGGRGQLGSELQRIFNDGCSEIGTIPALYADAEVVATNANTLDVTDHEAVTSHIAGGAFDLVINCAAMTDVDGCEKAEDIAFRVNAEAPGNLARACEKAHAKLVQISTDYVFPGTDPVPRTEEDATGPLSAYGRTKLLGEQLALENSSRCFVVRTAWLYGYEGKNFVKTMLRLGDDRSEVTVVDDQRGNPTSANDLAHEILEIAATDNYGIYHCTNQGTCSWADFAQAIMKGAGLDCEVKRCTSQEYIAMNPSSAARPLYSSLQNKHLEDTIGDNMRPWEDALANFLLNLT